MSYDRRKGESGYEDSGHDHDHVGHTPGKRTLTQQLPRRTHHADAAVGGEATGSGAAPVGAADASQADQMAGKKVKVTVTSLANAPAEGPAITFDAADYKGLYQQVKARADTGKEAGSVSRGWGEDYVFPENDAEDVREAKYDIPLTMSLPKWTTRDSQPKEDQKKYDGWAASVKTHEDQHVAIYRTEYAKLKTSVVGPTTTLAKSQANTVDTDAETAQQDFDNANQPAGLPIPGGTEKVP
jgi:hypothetical protein